MLNAKDPQQELQQAADRATQEAVQLMTAELMTIVADIRKLDSKRTGNGEMKRNGRQNGTLGEAEPLEIQLGESVLYRDDAREAYFNTSVLEKASFLAEALNGLPGDRVHEEDVCASITIGDRQVFAIEQGIITVNELPGREREGNDDLDPVRTHLSELHGDGGSRGRDGKNDRQSNGRHPNGFHAESIQEPEPIAFHLQPVRGTLPFILERMDNTHNLTAPVKGEKWMKIQLTQRLWEAIAQRLTFIRRQQVASTAIDLLQKYGTREGTQFVYRSENYTLKGQGKFVTVCDREGRELLFVRTRVVGAPKVMGYYLIPNEEQDFLQVRDRIKQLGLSHLSKDPLVRSKQLGNLTPAGDSKVTSDLQGLAIVDVARHFLDLSGSVSERDRTRVLEGSQYRIEDSPYGLTIETQDRGEILSLKNGKLTSNITPQDVRHFLFVAKELSRDPEMTHEHYL